MIRAFVKADDDGGQAFIADHYEFETLPRIGEFLVVTNEEGDWMLKVSEVTHYANFNGTVTNLNSPRLMCELIGSC